MTVKKLSISLDAGLFPYVEKAAADENMTLSAFIARAVKLDLYRRAGEERRRVDAARGVDREQWEMESERAAREDRVRTKKVKGAA